MHNISLLEAYYKKYITDISSYLPEDIVTVDLALLHELDLLNYFDPEQNDPSLTRYFHVVESNDKITLINEDFIIWIVPEKIEDITLTYTLIALNDETQQPDLQMCFVATGVYNTSRLVLRVLEKFLYEIQESENFIRELEGQPENEND
jgi:hypothetical protein